MKNYWKNKNVLVSGGFGFVGSHVVEMLYERKASVTVFGHVPKKNNYLLHLKDRVRFIHGDCGNLDDAKAACKDQDVVINMAARVGGIEYNQAHQASILRENLRIGSEMLEAARIANVQRFLVVSSACIYPRDAKIPTPESEGFRGEPEPTNGGYGWAKRMAEKLGMYYSEQYNMDIGIVRPYNIYGPRDHFDPKKSHVIPALIHRVYSGENPLSVWGSGKQTRAFLYVTDAARGIIEAVWKYPKPDPVNLGTDEEVSIKDLVNLIVQFSKKDVSITFDTSKPDGSPRRNSDNTKAKACIGFEPIVSIDEGLRETIRWYEKHMMV